MAAAKGNDYTLKRKVNPQHTKDEINDICEKLLEWGSTGEDIWLESFCYKTWKRSSVWLHNLGEHHPEVKETIKEAKELNGGKVANHCWVGDRNSSFGEKILPIYSTAYKDETVRKAKLSTNSDEKQFSLSDLIRLKESGELLKLLSQPDKIDD